ncbi:hypothetical protein BJ170DRAFT_698988 [Xylariales sp. AK1849]|nr:hypothetical protein BJ170DRAFT_698988 [Xylariales sp. AK1849]
MHIVVVGAGLAGLTVAIALKKAGHEVTVVEAAPQITYIGAGIQLSSNASRILRELGIDEYVERFCTEPVDLRMMRWENGQKLVELGPPIGTWHIHRADFHRGLTHCADDLGVRILLDSRVIKLEPETPAVILRRGERLIADLVVASDGLHSTCREIVLGCHSPPEPTGQMVYRVTLPAKELEGIPELEELITTPRNNHWIGPYGTVLSYLLEGVNETLINFVFTYVQLFRLCLGCCPSAKQAMGTGEDVRKLFEGWDPRLHSMLSHVDKVLEWRLFTHQEIPYWTHASSKLCLIGDAAHAMTPYLAQGAAMGIEDAAILGGILAQPDFYYPSGLPQALKLYEELRIKRAAKVAEASISSRWFTQMDDGEDQSQRDEWLLTHPGIWPGHINIRSRKEFLDDLFGYDAYEVLEAGLRDARKPNMRPTTAGEVEAGMLSQKT